MHKLTLHLALTRIERAIQNISATYLHFTEIYPLPIHQIHVYIFKDIGNFPNNTPANYFIVTKSI